MGTLIFPLVLAVIMSVTFTLHVDLDFTCDYAYGRPLLYHSRRYYDEHSTLLEGSKILNVTLPEFGLGLEVVFLCVNVTDVDTETTDVSFSVTNDRLVTVLVTLAEKARTNISVDIRAQIVNMLIDLPFMLEE